MDVCMDGPAYYKCPGQVKYRGADGINTVEQKTQDIKQHGNLELIADVVGYHQHIVRPGVIIQRGFIQIHLACLNRPVVFNYLALIIYQVLCLRVLTG